MVCLKQSSLFVTTKIQNTQKRNKHPWNLPKIHVVWDLFVFFLQAKIPCDFFTSNTLFPPPLETKDQPTASQGTIAARSSAGVLRGRMDDDDDIFCGYVKIFGLEFCTPTIFWGEEENDENFVAYFFPGLNQLAFRICTALPEILMLGNHGNILGLGESG